MLDLANSRSNAPSSTASSVSHFSGNPYSSGPDNTDCTDGIHVIIDSTSTDRASLCRTQTQEYDQFLNEYYCVGNTSQAHSRGLSLLPMNCSGEENQLRPPMMLIHASKSASSMPAKNAGADLNSFHNQNDLDLSSPGKTYLSASDSNNSHSHRQEIHSSADVEIAFYLKDGDESSPYENQGSDVGSPARCCVNKARYSADIERLMKHAKEHHFSSPLDKMSVSAHVAGSSTEEDPGIRGLFPFGRITKALSLSSIPAASNDKHKGYKDCRHPANFASDSSNSLKPKQKDKDEKKHKISMFYRLYNNSYRKKKDKEGKVKTSSTHRFVSVSFSNATTCDVCYKPLTNKPAMRCQICQINVHEASCKEQVTACDKFKSKSQFPRQSSAENEIGPSASQERNKVLIGAPTLRSGYSVKENGSSRPQTMYCGSSTQPVPINSAQIITEGQKQPASAHSQRKSLPTPSRAIVEEIEANSVPRLDLGQPSRPDIGHPSRQDLGHHSRLDLGHSNITESISHSVESLDEFDITHELHIDDVEFSNLVIEEPETWSETMDKKVLKKLQTKDIKRQDTIWELIQTERHYCKRLKTIQRVFRDGMKEVLNMTNEFLERMFPHLDDLISVHMNFLRQLQDLQNKMPDKTIEEIGPVLHDHFSGESANTMKKSYGTFCSRHLESVQCYKDLMARDKSFQEFIKKRTNLPLCKKIEIPDFILLVTQRPTKYPTLIEAVIKTTKDKKERESLLKVLDKSKEVLQSINEQVAASERAARLREISNKLDGRSFALYRGKKFRKSDIASGKRLLLHDGIISWRNARGKSVEVLAVVLTDVLLFLQENNQKYSFFSQDNKACVVSLFNLLVREKCDTKDTKGLYIISKYRQNPEMYEVVFNTSSDMQKWAAILRSAVEHCPAEDEDEVQKEAEAERHHLEEKEAQVRIITEKLNQKDEEIQRLCNEKNLLLAELEAVYNDNDNQQHSRPSSRDLDEILAGSENAHVLLEVSKVATQLTTMLQAPGSSLGRSVSSVGEHLSRNFSAIPVPKRAETFAGFDNQNTTLVKLQGTDIVDVVTDRYQEITYKEHDVSDPDIGMKQPYDSESESGKGSSSNLSSSSLLSPSSAMIHGSSQEQISIACLAQTLNNIVHMIAKQGTTVEKLRGQLAEANEKINKLSAEVQDRKIGNRHNQLEELRNLQGVIQKEKEEWEVKKTGEKSNIELKYQELEELKRSLNKQENDLKQQKEELNKKREVLQRQRDLLRQSGQLPRVMSLSDQEVTFTGMEMDNVQSSDEFVPGHRRSSSAEFLKSNIGENKSNTGDNKPAATALKENNFRPEQKSLTKLQSFSFGGSKQPLPVHLLSATNEQKLGSKNIQQIPSKLLTGVSVSTSQQMTQFPGGQGHSGLNSSHASQSSSALLGDVSAQGDRGYLGHSSSTISVRNNHSQLGNNSSVPKSGCVSNQPKPPLAGISGVLKLAEKGDKKSVKGSSQAAGDRGVPLLHGDNVQPLQRPKSATPSNKNLEIIHKSQKSDSDVIYF